MGEIGEGEKMGGGGGRGALTVVTAGITENRGPSSVITSQTRRVSLLSEKR